MKDKKVLKRGSARMKERGFIQMSVWLTAEEVSAISKAAAKVNKSGRNFIRAAIREACDETFMKWH